MKKLFDEIPHLENDRILLREVTDADIPALMELIQNKRVYRYLPTFLFEKRYADLHEMLRRLYGECFESRESLILGICLKEQNAFCGLAEFYGYKPTLRKTCLGYRLLERYWGRGIASEAVRLMVEYLYTQTDVEIITASTMVQNRASAHVLEKNGFTMTASSVPEDWGYPQPTIADKWFR